MLWLLSAYLLLQWQPIIFFLECCSLLKSKNVLNSQSVKLFYRPLHNKVSFEGRVPRSYLFPGQKRKRREFSVKKNFLRDHPFSVNGTILLPTRNTQLKIPNKHTTSALKTCLASCVVHLNVYLNYLRNWLALNLKNNNWAVFKTKYNTSCEWVIHKTWWNQHQGLCKVLKFGLLLKSSFG